MADEYGWEQFADELDEMTKVFTAQLAEAANAKNVRRIVRGLRSHLSGQPNADIAAALITIVAEFIQRSGSTPGEGITLMNVLFREIISALGRPPSN